MVIFGYLEQVSLQPSYKAFFGLIDYFGPFMVNYGLFGYFGYFGNFWSFLVILIILIILVIFG